MGFEAGEKRARSNDCIQEVIVKCKIKGDMCHCKPWYSKSRSPAMVKEEKSGLQLQLRRKIEIPFSLVTDFSAAGP